MVAKHRGLETSASTLFEQRVGHVLRGRAGNGSVSRDAKNLRNKRAQSARLLENRRVGMLCDAGRGFLDAGEVQRWIRASVANLSF